MTKTVHKQERKARITQSIIDSIRPPTPAPAPSWIEMMQALDDLERAGGTGAVYPDSRVHAGDQHLDHPTTAFFQGFVHGFVEAKFGKRLILTDTGERAVIRYRWGKLPEPPARGPRR